MSKSPDLTTAELRVMKALWQLGDATVAEVRTELSRRGTARTRLDRNYDCSNPTGPS